jgi:predicted alpha/beta-hydrolase family hydrolase
MLAAEDPAVADTLLLLSYPLHPPRRPEQLRTAHFPKLLTPAVFIHGSRDPFGTIEEMRSALALIPARTELVEVEGAGHDLKSKGSAARALKHFMAFAFSRYNSTTQV